MFSRLPFRSSNAGPHPAATAHLSTSLPSSYRLAEYQATHVSGHGKCRPKTPVGMLECWLVAGPGSQSLYQGIILPLYQMTGDSGLEDPPRLETSIPATTLPYATGRYQNHSKSLPGMFAPLATGEGHSTTNSHNHSEETPLLQGWPDSYQDAQHCAVCARLCLKL